MSTANLVLFVWVFCLGPGPVPCFASLLFLFGETQIWPGDLRVVGFGGLWCCFCLMICLFLMKPRRFMLNFLICLLAYPNVRTEPQSDIGHNRGKKSESRNSSVVRPWKFEQNILGQALRQALRQASRASRHGNWNKTI